MDPIGFLGSELRDSRIPPVQPESSQHMHVHVQSSPLTSKLPEKNTDTIIDNYSTSTPHTEPPVAEKHVSNVVLH